MTGLGSKRATAWLALLVLMAAAGCRDHDKVHLVEVSLSNTQLYLHPTVGGDEEGARISTQARHFSVSEIRRSEATNFVATYVYQAAPGFVGTDWAEIDVLRGSVATAPTHINRIAFRFVVHD